jgi:hypothetical protein
MESEIMKYRIRVTTGTEYAGVIPLSSEARDQATVDCKLYACDKWGGCTLTYGNGVWRNDAGEIVVEISATFEILADSPLQSNDALPSVHLRYVKERAYAFARYVKAVFQQQCVVLTVEQVEHCEFVTGG